MDPHCLSRMPQHTSVDGRVDTIRDGPSGGGGGVGIAYPWMASYIWNQVKHVSLACASSYYPFV